ncbi:MAG: aldehyde dehydrogenase family protein [Bdellovibrionota bacterium]
MASNNSLFEKVNPYSGKPMESVQRSEALNVIQSIQTVKKALPAWSQTSSEEKIKVFRSWIEMITANLDQWVSLEATESGLSHEFVREEGFQPVIDLLNQTIAILNQPPGESDQSVGILSEGSAQPGQSSSPSVVPPTATGVIAIITSWNLSFRLVMERLIPGLAAGNVVLVNSSFHVPSTKNILSQLLNSDLLKQSVQHLFSNEDALSILINHPGIRAISYVGSEDNFKKLVQPESWLQKKFQLSLGTKNNLVLLPGCDLSQLPQILRASLCGMGQLCWNTPRIFLLDSMKEEFVRALKDFSAGLKPSLVESDGNLLTPLIDQHRVNATVAKKKQIIQEGGKILCGGEMVDSPSGLHFNPLFSEDLPNCSELQQDNLGLPVFLVTTVKYQHEMAKWANLSPYSQLTSIWGDETKAGKVASQLDSAIIQLNHWTTKIPAGTGRKLSFVGNSDFGIHGSFYSDPRALVKN